MSQQAATKPRVALLFGGQSSEHPVSCVTAGGVLQAIDREKFDVIPVGITREGDWTLVEEDPSSWTLSGGQLPEVKHVSRPVLLSSTADQTRLIARDGDRIEDLGRVDVVFPLLHGPFGEDGSVQGLLEVNGVPYVGSGIAASAVGMDKHFMKVVFEAAGFGVGPYVVIGAKEWLRDPEAALAKCGQLEYPLFVKPARAGSSVGITKVDSPEQLRAAIEVARAEDPKIVIEQGIEGREIECGVLEGQGHAEAQASLPGEIVVESQDNAFYDFQAKYVDGGAAKLSCPAALSETAIAAVRELAVKAFDAVNAEGLSRVDFFYTPNGEWIINEINTMPGFTPSSMYPHMWQKTGIEYHDLIDRLIHLALDRPKGLR